MSMLMKSEILPQLDFSDWDVCLDCIKGKQTKHISKNPATRSSQLLELIHIDICVVHLMLHLLIRNFIINYGNAFHLATCSKLKTNLTWTAPTIFNS